MSLSGFRSEASLPKMIHQAVDVFTETSEEISSVRRRTVRLEEEEEEEDKVAGACEEGVDDEALGSTISKHPAEEAMMEDEELRTPKPCADDDGETGNNRTDVKSTNILMPSSPSADAASPKSVAT